jgi:hypothetical protein
MKILDFTPDVSVRRGQCTINISIKGLISVSGEACRLLGIKSGDEVIISYDKDNKKDWFIRKGESIEGRKIILRPHLKNKVDKEQHLLANCSSLTNEILASLKSLNKTAVMMISKEPVECDGIKYYPIITAGVK